jgi:hypothetical protein
MVLAAVVREEEASGKATTTTRSLEGRAEAIYQSSPLKLPGCYLLCQRGSSDNNSCFLVCSELAVAAAKKDKCTVEELLRRLPRSDQQ